MLSKPDAAASPGLSSCPSSCRRWVLAAKDTEGGLSWWCWCREDIPGRRGAAGYSPGPSGVQSSGQEPGWCGGSALPTSLFPFSAGSFPRRRPGWALGDPSGALCLQVGAGGAAKPRRLLLAPTLLLHDRAGSTLTDPEQHAAAGRGAALHPSAPPARPPRTPQPHRAPTRSPRPCSQHPAAVTPASHGSWLWGHQRPGTSPPGALPSSPSLLLLPSMAVGAEGSLPTLSFSLLARLPCSLVPRLGSAVAQVWEQGTVPACQPCRRQDFGSRLPRSAAAAPAQLPAPPPPADKAQPDKAAASLAGPRVRGQGTANPLLQPLAKPGRSPRLPVPGSGRGQRRAAAPRGRPWAGGRRDGRGGHGQPARG